jgi:hypothetical protein
MRTPFRLPALAALCCCLLGCTAGMTRTDPAAPATPPVPAGPAANDVWQIKLIRSGGLAGREEHFTANGASTALLMTDASRGTGTTIALTAAQRLELAQTVAGRTSAPDIESVSASCRDCYRFEMTISSGPDGRQRSVLLDSVTIGESPDARLIELVMAMARAGSTAGNP